MEHHIHVHIHVLGELNVACVMALILVTICINLPEFDAQVSSAENELDREKS